MYVKLPPLFFLNYEAVWLTQIWQMGD